MKPILLLSLIICCFFSAPAQSFKESIILCAGKTIRFTASQDIKKNDVLETSDGVKTTTEKVKMPNLTERMLKNEFDSILTSMYPTLVSLCHAMDISRLLQFIDYFSTDAAAFLVRADQPQTVRLDGAHYLQLNKTPSGDYLVSEITTAPRNSAKDILRINYSTPGVQLISPNITADPILQAHLDSLASLLALINLNFRPQLYLIPGANLNTDNSQVLAYLDENTYDISTAIIPPDIALKLLAVKIVLPRTAAADLMGYTIQSH